MRVSRRTAICVATALLFGLGVPGGAALGQSPGPASTDAGSILRPLIEIGRVRARTPYCAALAKARPGIDAAIAYEYAVPIIAKELREFRLDSHLTKYQSLKRSEHDLTALWNIAKEGRAQVQALREAANAPGVDDARRKELLAFADALDGAKVRQMWLAKSIARNLAVLAEVPVRNIADKPSDDHAGGAFATKLDTTSWVSADPSPAPSITTTQSDAVADHEHLQSLFDTFAAEQPIREDLKVASQHAIAAMQLGGCESL